MTAVFETGTPRAERAFFTTMAGVFLLIVFIGFAPSYYLRGIIDPGHPLLPMTPLVHAHGLLFSLWILLFITQTSLVAAGRTDRHRRLGVLGVVLAGAIIVVGFLTAIHGVARASGPPGIDPLVWLAVPLFELSIFAILVGAGLLRRRDVHTHKRLMLIAMIGLMGPAVGRMPWPVALQAYVAFLGYVLLVPLVIWDFKSRRRPHPATVLGGMLLIGIQLVRMTVWQTPGWREFAGWVVGQ
jgi:hypothetical protein